MTNQNWDDSGFCADYQRIWEISHEEVHYGWLAVGEDTLKLLSDINLKCANVLDVGCGLGQNLIALAKKNALGFGLDISPSMLSAANNLISREELNNKITLEQGDMRDFSAFPEIDFDIILSIYSMEYLSGVQELRSVLHCLFNRLKPNGVLIMCFSHPSQCHRYIEIINKSVPQGTGKYRTYNYSFKDATEALIKAGFSIERIIEQETKNPSKLTYKNSVLFPYHFREGNSPFQEKLDEISNEAPHSIIYKARRQNDPLHGLPRQEKLNLGYRELWGYKRKVIKYDMIHYLGLTFHATFLAPRDNIIGIVDILTFNISKLDLDNSKKYIEISYSNADTPAEISTNSIFSQIHKKFMALGMKVNYEASHVDSVDKIRELRLHISSILGMSDIIMEKFSTTKIGLLVFVNGTEPSQGELPLDIIEARPGDHVQVSYIAYIDNKNTKQTQQVDLFE